MLVLLAIFSALTNVAMVDPGDESWATVIIITIMVLISGILRFVQETRSGNVAAKLSEMIHTTVCVTREGEKKEIPLEEIVVGDIVSLSAGDMLPADVRILRAKDLFLSQSSLTGESEPVEKSGAVCQTVGSLTECGNLAFMGSTVVSGSATAVVLAVGHDTMLGAMAKALNVKPPKTTFEKGVNSVSWVLIRFMLLMVPIVLLINGLSDGDWIQAGLFAISIAVGLTPEMLQKISALNDMAHERGESLAQMALNWILKDDALTSVLIGASSPAQIIENTTKIRRHAFTEEELQKIDRIVF